ncbi:MAG: hypothetical protein ILO42_03220 [Clostridia bacterium]|nr:hypothetical protein [Clostridia bacterium]
MQDKETRDREDKIESDGEIVAEKPAFLRWLGNFWFYHKWAVIAAVFVIVLLSVTVRQSCANARTDITVMYAGSCYMADSGFEACREAIADYLPADAGSDGRYEAGIAALHIYSEEQIRDREERARTDTSVIKVNNYVNTSELQSFDNLIVAGEYSVIIAEPWLYKRVAASGIVRKLDEVLGFTPEDAYDANAYPFCKTRLYLDNPDLFSDFSPDTLVFIRTKGILNGRNTTDYELSEKLFRAIVNGEKRGG